MLWALRCAGGAALSSCVVNEAVFTMKREKKPHTYRVGNSRCKAASKTGAATLERDELTREQRVLKETEAQRCIYRTGADEVVLRRAAIRALMEKGEL